MLSGASLRAVASDTPYSEAAAQRHMSRHVRAELLDAMPVRPHVADYAERLSGLLDDTASARAYARLVNDPKLLLMAVAQERETLVVSMGRLGITNAATAQGLAEARAMAEALCAVLPEVPSTVAAALVDRLESAGAVELADALRELIDRHHTPPPMEIAQ